MKKICLIFTLSLLFSLQQIKAGLVHEITFCGEKIPVTDNFVAEKMMNIIRKQIPTVNLPQLRQRANMYFSTVEYYLNATGLPEDFKYLPIVESGFNNVVSPAGAAGFWQLMVRTAQDWGLTVGGGVDERNDINKSTHAACKELARTYNMIKSKYKISSWVLTSAAYNFGIGNIFKNIERQGANYFQMNLNPETSQYVYKIIAIKELWEYPELYMKDFGYNVFNAASLASGVMTTKQVDAATFASMKVKVKEDDGNHPTSINENNIPTSTKNMKLKSHKDEVDYTKVKFVNAHIAGKYKNFVDGSLVTIELDEDLQVDNNFIRKGNIIKGTGWIIAESVFIDLGYGRSIILYDTNNQHNGISMNSLKNKTPLLIKVMNK